MKFKFTFSPLRGLPLGTVVDGYKLTQRSHTGMNAVGHRVDKRGSPTAPFDQVLLVHAESAVCGEDTPKEGK